MSALSEDKYAFSFLQLLALQKISCLDGVQQTSYLCWNLNHNNKIMQTNTALYLCLLFFLFLQNSTQKSCFEAINTRITFGELYKYVPSYKNVGQAERQYVCTQNTPCFQSTNQFFSYLGQLKNDPTCLCVEGFRSQCVIKANPLDNTGLKSIFMNGQFYGNEEFKFTEVKMVFMLQSLKIGATQIANQWYLDVAYPVQ